MKISILLAITLGLTMAVCSLAATLQCPQEIKTKQALQEKINGWGIFLDDWSTVHNLDRVTFYAGPPKEHASLAPDNEGTKGNKLIWTFGKDKIWLACGYLNTSVQLIQKLPDETKTCTVQYDSNFSKVVTIDCIK